MNVERLTNLTLNRLEEGSKEKLLDETEARLLTAVALRCMRLWRELRGDESRDRKRIGKEAQRPEESTENQD